LLPRDEFLRLIEASALTRKVLDEVADSRLLENREFQERGR
jgi:hypothetical protein